MPDGVLPAELRGFLEDHIDSIAQLEALLLLRNAPDVLWDLQDMAKRLYVGEAESLAILAHLTAHGLIRRDGDGYRLDPQSDGLLHAISLLTDHYRTHLIPITNLIHAKPRRIQQFADAFKLKKDWAVFGSHVEAQRQAA
jgi:hypothetical protein